MKTRKPKRVPPATAKRSKDRRLVLLDQRPLRETAASECGQAMAKLEKAKAEWRRYQHEDQTAFERWMASTFGVLLTQVRELETAVRDKEALVQEVELEMMFGGARSHRAAYAKIQNLRNNPPPAANPRGGKPPPDPPPDEEAFDDTPMGELDEFEQQILFEDFLFAAMGVDPGQLSDKMYKKMFADFKADILGVKSPGKSLQKQTSPAPPPPEQSRLKELYRQLVRRLHPDTKAGDDAPVSAIWHEVQEAYRDGNVERLEMLLAMTDVEANATGDHTSLAQMRSVLAELRRSFTAIQRNLRDAKKHLAWNFCRLSDRTVVERRVRRDLESRFSDFQDTLRDLNATIASWTAKPRGAAKPNISKKPVRKWETDFFF